MPSEVPFRELKKLLEAHRWSLDRITGSHHIFRKAGERLSISIPVHGGRVAFKYVRNLEKNHGIRF